MLAVWPWWLSLWYPGRWHACHHAWAFGAHKSVLYYSYKPKHIENQVCTTSGAGLLIMWRIWSWAMKWPVFPPFNHRLILGAANTIRQISSWCSSFYHPSPGFHCLGTKVYIRQEVAQLRRTSMAYSGALPRLAVMFLIYAIYVLYESICTICTICNMFIPADRQAIHPEKSEPGAGCCQQKLQVGFPKSFLPNCSALISSYRGRA